MRVNILLGVLLVIQQVYARATWRSTNGLWQDCTNPSSPLHITGMNIEPNPVVLPGDIFFSIEGYSNRTVGSSALHFDIVREGTWFNLPIPCIGNIGSCTYDDMCTMLDDMVNENWMGITRNLAQGIQQMLRRNGMSPGLCPQPPQSISIVRNILQLPRMPSALYWFAEGDYRANVRVTDNTNGEELICFNVKLSVKKNNRECSGFWDCLLS